MKTHGEPTGIRLPEDSLDQIIQVVIFSVLGAMALNTLTVYIGMIVGISFAAYSVVTMFVCISVPIACFYKFRESLALQFLSLWKSSRHEGITLLALCISGTIFALITYRTGSDDYYYLANARYYLDNPASLLSIDIHYLYADSIPFKSLTWIASVPYELFITAFSFTTGFELLSGYYFLFPAVTGFLIPLTLYYFSRLFIDEKMTAIVSVAIAMLTITCLFDTHRTFGNFSFVRVHHGKTLVMTAGLSVLCASSLSYLLLPGVRNWMKVFITTTAGLGITASSIVLFLPIGFIMVFSWLFTHGSIKLNYIYRIVLYGFSFAVMLVFSAVYKIGFSEGLGIESPANYNYPIDFFGQLDIFIPSGFPVTLTVVTAITILAVAILHGQQRWFLIFWICILLVVFLNPLSATVLIEHFTSPNIYWRLFYLWPFPLVAVLVGAHIFSWIKRRSGFDNRKLGLSMAALAMLAIFTIFEFRGVLAWPPRYQIPVKELRLSREIIAEAPEGLMLAPNPVSGIISILTSKYKQVSINTAGIVTLMAMRGDIEEGDKRMRAARSAD